MEDQRPYRLQSEQDIRAIQEKHQGEILTDDQIIAFVGNAQAGIDSSVVWFGYKIPLEQTPFYRFSTILVDNYDRLNPDEKLQFLSSAGKFVLGAIRSAVSVAHARVRFFSREAYTDYSGTKFSLHPLEIRTRNTGEYLLRCLEFCQGDVQQAKEFIIGSVKDFDPKMWQESNRLPLIRFYSKPKEEEHRKSNERIGAISDRYISISPKIAQLAFLVEADLLGFSSGLLFSLLESVFPTTHTDVKTEIMRYISQKILNKGFNKNELAEIVLFLKKNINFYQELMTENPTDPLAQSYELTNKSLRLNNLRDKFRGGKIDAEDLINLLEENPFFVQYVSNDELEKALGLTKDHGIALRIEKIMREKKELTPTAPHL